MIRKFNLNVKIAWLLLCLQLAPLPLVVAADTNASSKNSSSTTTNETIRPIQPGPDDGRIAYFTAWLLVNHHYSRMPFDDSVSSQFLDRYLDSLDSQHLYFTRGDLDQFERYRTNLDNLTMPRKGGVADVTPAYEIFARYLERAQQRVACVDEWLKSGKFDFTTDERVTIDRHEMPYPATLDDAKALWLQRLRFDYLQEKLGLTSKKVASTNGVAEKPLTPEALHEKIADTLTHRYHRNLKMFKDYNNEDVMGIYLSALTHVYDPHSDYFNKEQLESFKISMNLELFGIGAELKWDDGYCKIERLLPGGPAAKSKKLNPGDRIIAVAQGDEKPVDIVDMSLSKAVQLIRGPKGTEVRLTILPAGANSDRTVLPLVRDEIPLDDKAAKGKIIEIPRPNAPAVRLGVIDLPSFYAPMDQQAPKPGSKEPSGSYTSVDVAKLLNKFKKEGVNGVVLDLRYNGGGSLEEAIRLAGLFIKEGPIVQTREVDGTLKVDPDTDPSVTYEGPLIVLTSRFSASASEIVAGALQDYGRAIIVGDTSTHGKGTVQTVSYLSSLIKFNDPDPEKPGALKFTIRKFYRASGASTQWKGVLPDIVLPSRWNYAEDIGEKSLKNSLEWDTIKSADYEPLNLVQPYLTELLKRSSARVATNEDFGFVRQDIEQFRKQQAEKTISLNEQQRIKENEELDARQKALEKDLRARKEPDEKVYEISLKQADLPGLPAPVQKTNSVAMKGGSGAAGGTNSASVSISMAASDLDENWDSAEKTALPDADLNESEHILLDYLSLLPKGSPLLVNTATK
jgi:carboxyl-terminal processing protease